MTKNYLAPAVTVILYCKSDIITASGDYGYIDLDWVDETDIWGGQ